MSRFDPDILARARAFLAPAEAPKTAAVPKPAPSQEAKPGSAAEITAALCRRFEGFLSHPYICPAGVPTIGYGATHYLDGRRVTMKDPPISRDAADRLLIRMIESAYMPPVITLCPGADTPGRLAALTDFAFNCGVGALKASTLRRKVNAGDWDAVPAELLSGSMVAVAAFLALSVAVKLRSQSYDPPTCTASPVSARIRADKPRARNCRQR